MLKPKQTDGEDAVNGGLGLAGVDGDDGPGLAAVDERAAGEGGTEGVLEIHGGAEAGGVFVGKGADDGALELPEEEPAAALVGGGGANLTAGRELEDVCARLSEASGGKAENVATGRGRDDAADGVARVGPEMQGAEVVIAEQRVLRGGEVEEDAAIFEQNAGRVCGEEMLDSGNDGGRRLMID